MAKQRILRFPEGFLCDESAGASAATTAHPRVNRSRTEKQSKPPFVRWLALFFGSYRFLIASCLYLRHFSIVKLVLQYKEQLC
ncbi:MAG: hypothetical protein AUG54_05725 [Ktedonobacter sp. 13_1_20CM_4_53_7]|nr:MAG: hypothetical protein AUG54_05725 [Ktedonobacter sp. 13_1_20CM_4_53_7]